MTEQASQLHPPVHLGAQQTQTSPQIQTASTSTPASTAPATAPATTTANTKKRVRTGRLNCRRKHKKCDETKPICKTCQLKNEQCEWPTPKLKKSSSRRSSSSNGYMGNNISGGYTTNGYLQPGRVSTSISGPSSNTSLGSLGSVSQNYPLYSRPIPNQMGIHQLKRPRLEGSSPLEQQNMIPPPTAANQQQQQQQQQLQQFPQAQVQSQSQQQQQSLPHPISPFGPAYEAQEPRRASTDLSSYSLGRAINTPAVSSSQLQHVQQNGVLSYPYQQQQRDQFLDPNRPIPPRLNLNNLLNNQYQEQQQQIRPHQQQQPQQQSQQSIKRLSLDSSSGFTQLSVQNGGELTPRTSLTAKSSISLDIPSFKNLNSIIQEFMKTGFSTVSKFPQVQLSELEQSSLIHIFIKSVSLKLNVLNNDFWNNKVPRISQTNTLVRYAIYAIALFQDRNYEKGMQAYATALNHLEDKTDLSSLFISLTLMALISTMVLEYEDWRPNIKQLANFMGKKACTEASKHLNCLSWCALMDINTLDIGEESTIFNIDALLQTNNEWSEMSQIISYLSQSINLISSDNSDTESEFDQKWENIWCKVNEWNIAKSTDLTPLLEFDYSTSLFPIVSYNSGPAALANQLYHTIVILLIQNKPRLYKIRDQKNIRPITWHAKQIIGTVLNNEFLECWNNSNQCVWIAGKLLTHQDEHKTVLNMVEKISGITYQSGKYKCGDFRNYWEIS